MTSCLSANLMEGCAQLGRGLCSEPVREALLFIALAAIAALGAAFLFNSPGLCDIQAFAFGVFCAVGSGVLGSFAIYKLFQFTIS